MMPDAPLPPVPSEEENEYYDILHYDQHWQEWVPKGYVLSRPQGFSMLDRKRKGNPSGNYRMVLVTERVTYTEV